MIKYYACESRSNFVDIKQFEKQFDRMVGELRIPIGKYTSSNVKGGRSPRGGM
jgi:hypothetical protein